MNTYKFGDIFSNGNGKFVCTIMAETIEEAIAKYKIKELNPEKHILSKQFGKNDPNSSILITDRNIVVDVLRLSDCQDFDYSDIDIIPFDSKMELRERMKSNTERISKLRTEINNLEKENKEYTELLNQAANEFDITGKKMYENSYVQIAEHKHQSHNTTTFTHWQGNNLEEIISGLNGTYSNKMSGKEIVDVFHSAISDTVKDNTIFSFSTENRHMVVIFDCEKATYVVNDNVHGYKKFMEYVFDIAGVEPDSLAEELPNQMNLSGSFKSGMKCVLPNGEIVTKQKTTDLKILENAISSSHFSKGTLNYMFVCGYITKEQYAAVIKMKEEAEEEFQSYIDRNAKRIGYDPNNIAQEMILTNYFENECNFDMFGVNTKVLRQLLTGNN